MVTRFSFVLLALAVTVSPLPGAEAKAEGNRVELKKGDHILFYGDSLTEQARGPKGWVTIVRDALKEKHPDLGVEVSTFAIGGYCIVDRDVATMRWMCIFSRSRHSGTRGAILVFQ